MRHDRIVITNLVLLLVGSSFLHAQDQIDFNRDIRPILSDKCLLCHGPDNEGRKADLRLDVEADAHDYAFVPGSLSDSEGWQRIVSDDEGDVMPPPDSHKELSDEEKEIIKRWIESGAKYEKHWAFRAVQNPAVPQVDDPRFSRTALDAFALKGMKSKGLNPSPRAKREALIRRVTLDLTGLPPTLAEVDAFLADESPQAFEKVVDRLLASPRFGERMAVDWMDIARYGDTSVFHADGPRDMWRWRDWVVNAYNSNMPFDQFTIKQLAGDLLPNRTVEDQIASGFNRNNASTDEGGAIAEEFRVEYAVDRVKTTSMVWMGLSMECAQCHDHKYDPISQEDYYRFFAFFNQAADPGMQTRRGNQTPIVNVLDDEKIAQVPGVEKQIADYHQQIVKLKADQQQAFKTWLEVAKQNPKSYDPPADTSAHFTFDEGHTHLINKSDESDKAIVVDAAQFPEGKIGKAFRANANSFIRSPKTAAEFAGDTPISYGCWVKVAGGQGGAPIARMNDANAYRGFDLYLQGDGVAAHFVHQWPNDAVKVIAKTKLENNRWNHLFVTYDGSKKAAGIKIYVNGQLIQSSPSHNSLKGSTKSSAAFTVGRRTDGSPFNGLVDDIRIYDRELTAVEVATVAQSDPLPDLLAIDPYWRSPEDSERLFTIFLERNVEQFNQLNRSIVDARNRIEQLKKPLTSVMVMQDVAQPRMTFVLDRGQYDSPNKEKQVEAGVPEFLPPFAEGFEQNRLGMAKWLTMPNHPLTSRVTVNRFWKMFFGNGLVESVEDFGLQGTWPTHPELLDWLAHDFVANGWDMKRLVKMIVTSEVYMQSSVVTEDQLKLDPANQYVSRGPRFRLKGEFLRDQVLAISGLLNEEMGGAGVKPYQPDGLWNEVSLNGGLRFRRDSGDKLYRRSLYTYWKRSAPPPNMVLFDAPTREKCTIRRGRTNTPLQALVLMNDPQFVEAARMFAERVLAEGGNSIDDRIKHAVRLATGNAPSKEMVQVIQEIYESELAVFQENPDRAKKLLAVGEKPRNEQLDAAEHAAWTVVCNLIFNLDEFVTRG